MELAVTKRAPKSPNTLRREGVLPAVLYGRSQEATPIQVDRKVFEKLFHQAGESTVITLTGLTDKAGLPAGRQALIQEVATDPVTGVAIHADFYAIEKGQKVTVSVPFEFAGVAPAVKDLGGILTKVMHELEMEVEPGELPKHIVVDVTKLATLEDQIKVSDLVLPKSAKISIDADEVVAMISVAKEEVEEVAPMDITQIGDAVERGKKEEEGAEGAEGATPAAAAPKAKAPAKESKKE
ncbi:MAG: 50S ribosomal protein L25 [Patescibacteria group bacterium]